MWVPERYINSNNEEELINICEKNSKKLDEIQNSIINFTDSVKNNIESTKIYIPYVDNHIHTGKNNITLLSGNKIKMTVEIIFKNKKIYKIFPFGNEIPGIFLESEIFFDNGTVSTLKMENNKYVMIVNAQQDKITCCATLKQI